MKTNRLNHRQKAHIISVNMGYGHDRAAFALKSFAYGKIITANDYAGIPAEDKKLWTQGRNFYETISRAKSIPWIGPKIFKTYDEIQSIKPFYPRRDQSRPNVQVKQMYYLMKHKNFGRHLVETLSHRHLPIISTFFFPAFAAEYYGYPGEIYCVATDNDISRAWVSLDPKKSRIKYFAPNGRVVERLQLYGVPKKNIFLTGFPLPKELVDKPHSKQFDKDLHRRLCILDPKGIFHRRYEGILRNRFGVVCDIKQKQVAPVLTFAVGGAGAQSELGITILESLARNIARGDISLHLIAGTHKEAKNAFIKKIGQLRLKKYMNKNLHVMYNSDRGEYFKEFTNHLRQTDILWTKPSELSFYTGAGIPIIMSPSIGSQEDFNAEWLRVVGGGVPQQDPRYVNEWLFDWIDSGGLARMAWSGYAEAPTHGAYRIESVITDEEFPLEKIPLIV
jgi:hypothetical protein